MQFIDTELAVNPSTGIRNTDCLENGGILLANLFPHYRAAVATLDSPCSWAFNDGICEAQFSALPSSPTVSGGFRDASAQHGGWTDIDPDAALEIRVCRACQSFSEPVGSSGCSQAVVGERGFILR